MKSAVRIGICFLISLCFCSFVSCMSTGNKRTEVIDNTFRVDIANISHFEIEIDSQKIMPEKSIRHNLPLHESALYDGWNITYKIPISKKAFYLHSEKMTVADSQNIIEIKNPKAISEIESYILVKNNSTSSIQITSTGNNYIPVFLEGQINGISPSSDYYIPGRKTGIVKIKKAASLFIKNGDETHLLFKNKSFRLGFVYTYDYDGVSAALTDSRPIEKMAEPTWDCAIPEGVSVCRLARHSDSGALYVAGTETARDERGFPLLRGAAEKIMFPGDSGAGGTFVAYAPFEADGDVQFFDAAVSDGGELVAVGQLSAEEPCGIIVRYTADGAVSDFVATEETVALGALCRKSGSSFFASGIDSDGNIVIMSVSCGTSTECRNIASLAMPDGEAVDGLQLCYCAAEDCVLLAVNFNGQGGFSPSRLYRIAAGGAATEIDMQGKIGAVSSVIPNQDGGIFLAGETAAGVQAAASIVAVRNDGSFCETQFISPESPSWISDAWLDADGGELVVCGMTTQGKKRVPFLQAFDVRHFQTTWEQSYSAPAFKGMNDAPFVLPCADHGFLVGMSALDADNRRQAPFKIVRVTSSGRITEQHKTIQLQGVGK